jgi:hypothetical protein
MPDDLTDAEMYAQYGYCCACLGCSEHEHVCDRSEEERATRIKRHDETISVALRGGVGRHQLSDGSEIRVYRGPGDQEFPKGDGWDRQP